jgi:magnesium-protoporphyrin IX monomethyl ester (oxidative) cyclase
MKVLFVHPSGLMYSEVHLKLEPIGLELVAESARRAGHEVRLLDLQLFNHAEFARQLADFRPDAVGFSNNYLANVPEILDLSRRIKRTLPGCFVFVGGHSASFIASELIAHSGGAVDCVVRGEGEGVTPKLLEAVAAGRGVAGLPGVTTAEGFGPPPMRIDSLDDIRPARDLTRRREKYFIGILDPAASIEFSRGCPWDCNFCSAWTFYGRKYRKGDPERIADELASIREPGVFIVDDVAFIDAEQGHAIADAVERRKIRKQYYFETRADVLLKNRDVFRRWTKLGLAYMFLGLEAIDDEGLKAHRKRITMGKNYEALEVARSLGIEVAVNIIADPSWDESRFDVVREWACSVPEFVHLTVATPYPGTEIWLTESRRLTTRDYRLFDVQHAVLPTKLPLDRFYGKLVETQRVINAKQLSFRNLREAMVIAGQLLAQGQQNFARMLWKFDSVYNADRQYAEHRRPVRYAIGEPRPAAAGASRQELAAELYVHPA